MFDDSNDLLHIRLDGRRNPPAPFARSAIEITLRSVPLPAPAVSPVRATILHLVFDILAVLDLARQEKVPIAHTAKACRVASFIDAKHYLLDLLFTFPEELDRKGAAADDLSLTVAQQLTCLGRGAGHQPMPIVIDDIDGR